MIGANRFINDKNNIVSRFFLRKKGRHDARRGKTRIFKKIKRSGNQIFVVSRQRGLCESTVEKFYVQREKGNDNENIQKKNFPAAAVFRFHGKCQPAENKAGNQ